MIWATVVYLLYMESYSAYRLRRKTGYHLI